MIIAAVSDIHLPQNYEEFLRALDRMTTKPDLFLIAGDVVHRGDVKEYERLRNLFFGKIFCPIVACFGNNEFHEQRDWIKQNFREIKFLDDQVAELQINNEPVGIVGTTGSLEQPTKWQRSNVPEIENIYKRRIEFVRRSLERMRYGTRILLMHYSPTYKTLQGENPNFMGTMAHQEYENIIMATKPTLVVHGHSHRGLKHAWIDTVPVFNVNFSVNEEIVIIDTEKLKPGLGQFV